MLNNNDDNLIAAIERLQLKSEIQSERELRGEEAKQKEYLATENEKLKNDMERLERGEKKIHEFMYSGIHFD